MPIRFGTGCFKVGVFRDRLDWNQDAGEIKDGDARYVLIRSDALMGLFRLLPSDLRDQALCAFARSVREYGGRSAVKYQAEASALELVELIANGAPQLGLGALDRFTWTDRHAD